MPPLPGTDPCAAPSPVAPVKPGTAVEPETGFIAPSPVPGQLKTTGMSESPQPLAAPMTSISAANVDSATRPRTPLDSSLNMVLCAFDRGSAATGIGPVRTCPGSRKQETGHEMCSWRSQPPVRARRMGASLAEGTKHDSKLQCSRSAVLDEQTRAIHAVKGRAGGLPSGSLPVVYGGHAATRPTVKGPPLKPHRATLPRGVPGQRPSTMRADCL